MNKNNQVFKTILTTKGRKTGKDHSVLLRAVQYNDKIYFSRHKPDGDWFQNAIANPQVRVEFSNTSHSGNAIKITDEELAKKISLLKYSGEQRANEKRVVLEVTLCEQL
jgi:deazaflavin-dependent oxidoreductase (nitroreductase family)